MPKDYSQYITKKPAPEDKRPFLTRLFTSIRPKLTLQKKNNKTGLKIEISGKAEF